ncbi:MAG TPA: Glu-tRNA(Gln) amidotransferase GatDE subunit E, partial [Candidatus Korarchaeota archaeon]|nr:Glu-tRNA(Gln) amidotransferase GatDE subunit E [Candidatus Korarchaeota archaeon]
LARGEYESAEDFVRTHQLSVEELDSIIDEAISRLSEKIRERGDRAYGMLMGEVMKEVRGKIDGSIVSERVRKKLEEFLQAG